MSAIVPTFLFSPSYDAEEQVIDTVGDSISLGDGYEALSPGSLQQRTVWNLSRVGLRTEELTEIIEQLQLWGGTISFKWSPKPDEIPSRQYYCDTWSATPLGQDVWSIDLVLTEDILSECASFSLLLPEDEIESKLIGASSFLTNFSSNSGNYIIRSTTNLVARSLHTHSEQIPDTFGRLYDQLSLALGCIAAYEATETEIWLTRAESYGQAIIDRYYNSAPSDGSVYLPHWLRNVKGTEELRDIYPTSRTPNTGEVNAVIAWLPLLWELYTKLYEHTADTQWQTLANSTKADAIEAATFSNQSFIYRKNSGSVTEYPGTAIIGTATRETTGVLTDYVNVSGSDTLQVQNTGVQFAVQTDTTLVAEASANTDNRIVEFFLSTSTDDTSTTQLYTQFWRLGTADTVNSRTFNSDEFYRWNNLAWYYGVGLSAGTANYEANDISYLGTTRSHVVLRLEADATLNINVSARNPFKIFCRVTTSPATMRLQDFNGSYWDYELPVADWALKEPTWSDFTWSPSNVGSQGSLTPNTNGNIQNLQIITTGNVFIWWIGAAVPERLILPTIIYRAGIRDLNSGSRNLYVGDVYPTNSPTDLLPYTPGVVPFARNVVAGVPGTLTGLPYAGYQNVWGWQVWNEPTRLANVVSFLQASQAAYATATGDTGPFAPVYTWGDSLNSAQGGTLNQFGFNGFDDLETSGEYQAQVGLWLARAWNANRSNAQLRDLALSWLRWLDQVYATRQATLPPVTFTGTAVASAGHNPGVQALIGEAALWCNLAGGDPGMTFRWILRSLNYLDSQYVPTGNVMSGSWSNNQLTFDAILKQYYSWWHGACLSFYSNLTKNKPQITYPPCSEPLTIGTSEPFPEICCGAPIISMALSCPIYESEVITLRESALGLSISTGSEPFKGGFTLQGVGTSSPNRTTGLGGSGELSYSIPEDATLCRAILWWNIITSTDTNLTSITVNGQTVTGAQIGQGANTCWGGTGTVNKVYRTEATELIGEAKTGVLSVSGFPDVRIPIDSSQGVALLLIYNSPTGYLTSLDIYDGCAILREGGPTTYSLPLQRSGITYAGFGVGDGQPFDSLPFKISGQNIPGTAANGNDGSFMDTFVKRVDNLNPSAPLTVSTSYINDCLSWFLFIHAVSNEPLVAPPVFTGQDPDAQAFIGTLTGTYTDSELAAINNLFLGLKNLRLEEGGNAYDATNFAMLRWLSNVEDSRRDLKRTYLLEDTLPGTFISKQGMSLNGIDQAFRVFINPSQVTTSKEGFIGAYLRSSGSLGGRIISNDFETYIITYGDNDLDGGFNGSFSYSEFPNINGSVSVTRNYLLETLVSSNQSVHTSIFTNTSVIPNINAVGFGARYDRQAVDTFRAPFLEAQFGAVWGGFGKGMNETELKAYHALFEACADAFGAGVFAG
jgi:phage-related protein